jgi:Fe-S-cluster containining protein
MDINQSVDKLNEIYNRIPATTGCDGCEAKNGEDAHWCCRTNNPSMYRVEFLKVWQSVQKWDDDKKVDLFIKACKAYLTGSTVKSCIFWDEGCSCYENRPYACRLYGVVPHKTWEKRVKYLKQRFGYSLKIRPQCNLVKTVDGQKIKPEQDQAWFQLISACESMIGVSVDRIKLHDNEGGSYRTFHDHVLLSDGYQNILQLLTTIKESNPNDEQIESFLAILRKQVGKTDE